MRIINNCPDLIREAEYELIKTKDTERAAILLAVRAAALRTVNGDFINVNFRELVNKLTK